MSPECSQYPQTSDKKQLHSEMYTHEFLNRVELVNEGKSDEDFYEEDEFKGELNERLNKMHK